METKNLKLLARIIFFYENFLSKEVVKPMDEAFCTPYARLLPELKLNKMMVEKDSKYIFLFLF